MEKLQTLVWLLIGLGVFIWRMVQKARATTQQEQRERPRTTGKVPPLPSGSFDELLKQMQAQNRSAASPTAAPVTPAGRPLPRETTPPARSLERTETAARSLEQPITARSLEVPRREARLASSLPRTNTQHGQEDYWSRQPRPTQARETRRTVTDMLQNPADVRAAFVLGEILQRRF
ncbi:hypothetical protein [Hymenobacter swuensis]|uniref:Uncharacterized protein n=1 Tax=Hymenobacter swuensis DY53 TaxID=1227739 RepID=W8F8I0_9BACT|nr:hypothetical protein [Hymenobacter swuensis]AHJ98015.1 hypothetical protein Hsw_2420 [Hymenobacter swuensis DY53]